MAAGVSEAELHTALMQGVTVTDNRDESITPEFDASQVDTNKPGKYSVVYTARDRAGNQASASRQLVVSKTAAVLLIDGMAAVPYGTMILAKGTHRVLLAGTESEPVYMSYKEGYKTIGQMKTRSNVWIANREYTGPVTVELDRGLYTLYFRTQDRSCL